MDLNAALLTLIGELKMLVHEKDKHVENLVSINSQLAQELQNEKQLNSKLVEEVRILTAKMVEVNLCPQTSASQ